MKKLLIILSLLTTTSVYSFEIRSKIEEGALVYGKLNKEEKLFLNDKDFSF